MRERPREPPDPPVVAVAAQRRPVVERVAPQLALVGERVRRRARDGVVAEHPGVRAVVGRRRGDVDRDVTDQADAAIGGVRAQRGPLALEADLVGDRAAAREARPVLDPAGLALAEVELLRLADGRRGLGEQARPGRERRARLVRRAVAVGRAERQHLPPRLAGVREPVDPGVRVPPEAPSGQRRRVELHTRGAREVHVRQGYDAPSTGYSPRDAEAAATATDPHPVPAADRGRRPLPREADRRRPRRGRGRRVPRRPREAPRRHRPQGRRRAQLARVRAASDRRALQRRPLGRELRRRRARALGLDDRGLDRPLRDLARRAAAQAGGRAARPLGRAERGRPAAGGRGGAREGRRQEADRARPARAARRRDPRGGQARRRARAGALRGDRAQRGAPRRDPARARPRPRGRPRARALRLLVRAVPALVRRAEGCAGTAPAAARAGLRRRLRPADPPDRDHEPQGPQQHAGGRARRPRLAVRDRVRARRARRGRAVAGDDRGRPRPVRGGRRARHGHRARPRDQLLARPPVAQGAPGLVLPPPRRHAQVRREPAQEVPGHLQRQLGLAGLARALGRAAAGRGPDVGRDRA